MLPIERFPDDRTILSCRKNHFSCHRVFSCCEKKNIPAVKQKNCRHYVKKTFFLASENIPVSGVHLKLWNEF